MSRILPVVEVNPSVFWIPSKEWPGETVFVIGGGSSLKGMDWDLVAPYKCIGINDAYTLGPFVDYNIFGDTAWFRYHKDDLRYGTAVPVGITAQPQSDVSWVKWVRRRVRALGQAPGELGWFQNTGMSGIDLALKLGADKICLLGFDMKVDSETGEANWHPNDLNASDPKVYGKFLGAGKAFEKDIAERYSEIEIVNCNPDSAWDAFPKVKLEDVI